MLSETFGYWRHVEATRFAGSIASWTRKHGHSRRRRCVDRGVNRIGTKDTASIYISDSYGDTLIGMIETYILYVLVIVVF